MSGNILDLIKYQRSEILKDNERLDSLLASINTNVNKENKNSIVEEAQNVRIIRKNSTTKNSEENDEFRAENKNKPLILDENDAEFFFNNNKILTPLSSTSLDLENNDQNNKEKSNLTHQKDTSADKILTHQLLVKKAAPHLGIGEHDLINSRKKTDFFKLLINAKSVEIPNNSNEQLLLNNVKEQNAAQSSVSSPDSITDAILEPVLRKSKILPFCYDQRLTTEQNETILNNREKLTIMDKPKSILSNRRRERCFMDGFSYTDRHEELERERLKRDAYQRELRMQIEEKRHLVALHEEQERRERELETRRLEQQIQRMHDEEVHNQHKKSVRNELMRRHSDDLLRRKTELYELQRPSSLASRRYADSESGNLDILGASSSTQSNYLSNHHQNSPPTSSSSVNRRSYNLSTSVFPSQTTTNSSHNNLCSDYSYKTTPRYYDSPSSYPGESSISRNYSKTLNSSYYDTIPFPRGGQHHFQPHHHHHHHHHQQSATKFDRFDSLSRIDALNQRMDAMNIMTRDGYSQSSDLLTDIQRRHSATQQDLSNKSPRLSRRNSLSSRFEDTTLPIPMMVKALSPIAKELRNAVPFNSSYYSTSATASSNPTNRWSKNNLDSPSSSLLGGGGGGGNRGSSILTQLSSIRTQLQREQLRMDETLRNRGLNHHHLTTRTRTNNDDY